MTTDWHPTANPELLKLRSELLQQIRAFFLARGVLEVETPVLSAAGNSDPGIHQFHLDGQVAWLRTSPEYAMKRLLAAGSGDIFELGRVFRAGEEGRFHNREFTMLEWYRCGWTAAELMDEVAELVRQLFTDETLTETRLTYRDLFLAYTEIDPLVSSTAELEQRARDAGLELPGLDHNALLDLLFSHVIQPELSGEGLVFVYDFPESQAALARIRDTDPPVAERFELLVNGLELANGYRELTDPEEQRQRFERENRLRVDRGDHPVPLDQHLLAALESGLPDCSGVALGVDRLLMLVSGRERLSDVVTFAGERS